MEEADYNIIIYSKRKDEVLCGKESAMPQTV